MDIGEYVFDGRIYEGKVTNDVLILKHSMVEERCNTIDGSFCVHVQFRGVERERATRLMAQLSPSEKAQSFHSKLLLYDMSLSDIFCKEDVESGKFKCKICDQTLSSEKHESM